MVNQMNSIHINVIKSQLSDLNLIDIREEIEFLALPKLAEAKHIPMIKLIQSPENYLNQDTCYHLVCRSGARTAQVTAYLTSLGYNVVNVEGGMLEFYHD